MVQTEPLAGTYSTLVNFRGHNNNTAPIVAEVAVIFIHRVHATAFYLYMTTLRNI